MAEGWAIGKKEAKQDAALRWLVYQEDLIAPHNPEAGSMEEGEGPQSAHDEGEGAQNLGAAAAVQK